jgi:hypothetical protein
MLLQMLLGLLQMVLQMLLQMLLGLVEFFQDWCLLLFSPSADKQKKYKNIHGYFSAPFYFFVNFAST